jgi:hypothetical protein
MNCVRIIEEMMEYATNNMTIEEQKYLRKKMFDAVEELDELILSEEKE